MVQNGESEAALHDVAARERRVGHDKTRETIGSAEFVGAFIAFADGVIDRPGNGDLRRLGVRIGDAITEDGDGETGIIGIVRDEWGEGFESDVDWE